MGNSTCCLRNRGSISREEKTYAYEGHYTRNNHVEFQYVNQTFPRDETSTNFLPHISEREALEVGEEDPSTHPTARPTFMERSKSEMKYDSTISQPNLKNTIKCISLAIYYHIANRKNRAHERLMEIFEERLHPITREALPPEVMTKDPDHRQIYRFVRTLFHSAQLTAECAIITLVYIERLLNYAEMDLCPSNWRRVVLGAIMLASKVWDDQAVWNVDYCQILRDTNVDDMNELERRFLECLDFNIEVPSSVYAKYYFDLRTLALANDLQLPLQPLYKERAKRLEVSSNCVYVVVKSQVLYVRVFISSTLSSFPLFSLDF
ncbi:unnamed protein product [Angiostrongylus costaricensis]|uniref:CYCLIN domain-containing protein n=1 Tax=Angiostrongylus costaricensis TaxID=334426 RepID=A0A158PKK8_ANGCS|nr:unnamed protein product [Angiostrongylus costaricensis]